MRRQSVRTPMVELQRGREMEHWRTGATEDLSVPGLEQPRVGQASRTSIGAVKVARRREPERLRNRAAEEQIARIGAGGGFDPGGVRSEDTDSRGTEPRAQIRGCRAEGVRCKKGRAKWDEPRGSEPEG
jgi:hypothetical protein